MEPSVLLGWELESGQWQSMRVQMACSYTFQFLPLRCTHPEQYSNLSRLWIQTPGITGFLFAFQRSTCNSIIFISIPPSFALPIHHSTTAQECSLRAKARRHKPTSSSGPFVQGILLNLFCIISHWHDVLWQEASSLGSVSVPDCCRLRGLRRLIWSQHTYTPVCVCYHTPVGKFYLAKKPSPV